MNVVAAFGSPGDARRACGALRGARLKGAAIAAGQANKETGGVRLGGYASDRTIAGGLLGALAGLFLGAFMANLTGVTSSPVQILAVLVFGVAGGGVVGGMVAGAAEPEAGDDLSQALERLTEGELVHVAAHCGDQEEAILAANVLAGLRPLDLYCVGPRGQVIW